MSRFERHPALTIGLVLAAVAGAGLAASEALLSYGAGSMTVRADESLPGPERVIRLREWPPDTHFVFAPPEARFRNPGGPVHRLYDVVTDRDGFIAPGRVHESPELTVVFLGGSTTECLFVTPGERFPHLVGRLLEERLGRTVNSLNGGKSGNNSLHSLNALTAKVLPLRPDAVAFMHNVNDLALLSRTGSYWTSESDFAQIHTPRRDLETVARTLRDLTIPRTYRAVRRALARLAAALGGDAAAAEPGASPALPADGASLERSADDYESALRQFVATARA
ncbi:MAG: SGNH/GDSL hydrolase family protein, partial [Alphaproteobacteria bacterium]